ncbi:MULTISPECIES: NIPSNAP family protein [Nitrospirillum]|uniref:NIPSNAP protein n=1 Tax=Nitrospirillum amazonense TaxID=28077 RepID=A0A560G1M8_9PROT|nr:NIPSNAP family protein [Nitrospirillum amazonense]MEC4589473.1 NIPSNAP family protein [Nitrospirillum amazonense]TWB27721.1 NIPSNAP protein [Nitrospirillum amazonense]
MRLQTAVLLALTLLVGAGVADRALAWPPDLMPADALPLKVALRAEAPAPKAKVSPATGPAACCAVLELRQYTLKPGQRDVLIDLFDRYFLTGQEAVGVRVVGQFRDLDDPDRFVWLRGFPDMPARAAGLAAFYGGPVWQAHREAANGTMLDSDNVLLLRPASAASGFADAAPAPPPVTPSPAPLPPVPAPPGAPPAGHGMLVATFYYPFPAHDAAAALDLADAFARDGAPALAAAGGPILAAFVTNPEPNNFPRLPVREGEAVFVTFQAFADTAAYDRYRAHVATPWWRGHVLKGAPEVRRLAPTSGSRWQGPF